MKVAVLGTGKMASALVRGWSKAGILAPTDFFLANRSPQKASALAEELVSTSDITERPKTFNSFADAVQNADIVLIAVKPFAVMDALRAIKETVSPKSLIVSVAAGIRIESMESVFAQAQPVIRVMPNTPAAIGEAATAFCRGKYAEGNHAAIVQQLFASVGVCVEVTEDQLDAVIGVSGSGVAYMYLIIEALTDGGVRAGLPRDIARSLAAQTALGAAKMILETGEHPAVLKDAVTTPGGTTITALEVLEKAGIRGTLIEAVLAARNRARELS